HSGLKFDRLQHLADALIVGAQGLALQTPRKGVGVATRGARSLGESQGGPHEVGEPGDELHHQRSSASASRARKTVSPSISTTGLSPTLARSRSWVFMPMPAIAATRHQREKSLPAVVTTSGSQPVLLTATSTAKPTANHGSSGGRGPPVPLASARVHITANTITGSSI